MSGVIISGDSPGKYKHRLPGLYGYNLKMECLVYQKSAFQDTLMIVS